jgi:hypothetical protein
LTDPLPEPLTGPLDPPRSVGASVRVEAALRVSVSPLAELVPDDAEVPEALPAGLTAELVAALSAPGPPRAAKNLRASWPYKPLRSEPPPSDVPAPPPAARASRAAPGRSDASDANDKSSLGPARRWLDKINCPTEGVLAMLMGE